MANYLDMVSGVGQYASDPVGSFLGGLDAGQQFKIRKLTEQRTEEDRARASQARELAGQALTGNENALRSLAGVDPDTYTSVAKYQQKDPAAVADKIASLIHWADTPEKWDLAKQRIQAAGHTLSPEEQPFEARSGMLAEYVNLKQQHDLFPDYTLYQGTERRSGFDNKVLATGPEKTYAGTGDPEAFKGVVTGIADAIESGNQPPELKGLYKYGAAVRAELQRRGYNYTGAVLDYTAVQKQIAAANSPGQRKLLQSVDLVDHSIPMIEEAIQKWDAGNYPLFNKAALIAAEQTGDPLAAQLKAQIADMVAELATVYKGGNSSTDHTLALAAENLKADWSKAQMQASLDQIKKVLKIRRNSLNALNPLGTGDNPYDPTAATDSTGKTGELPEAEVQAIFNDAKEAIANGADPAAIKQQMIDDYNMDPAYIDQGLQ